MAFLDTWAVTPETDDDYYFASGTVGAAGAVTLLQTVAGQNGVGYKVLFTSAGNSSTMTYTIVGHAMGTPAGILTTEVVTGPNATTALSTNWYDRIVSITASAAATGSQKIGISGATVALPRTRVKGVYFVGGESGGSVSINLNSATGLQLLKLTAPASATSSNFIQTYNGILTGRSSAETDFAVVTNTSLTTLTIFCG